MKNSINLAKIRNGMLLNLSIVLGIAMLSSCSKEQTPSPSSSNSQAAYRAPEGDELLLSFTKKSLHEDEQAFNVQVLANGTVLFTGISGVALIGEEKFEIEREQAWDIALEMSNQGFYDLKDSDDDGSGNYSVTILNMDSDNEKIVIGYGSPDELRTIHEMIIERTGVREFIER